MESKKKPGGGAGDVIVSRLSPLSSNSRRVIEDVIACTSSQHHAVVPQLNAMLAAQEMVPVWRFLEAAEDPQVPGQSMSAALIETAYSALCGPQSADGTLSPREHVRWKQRVRRLARDLADALRDSRIDILVEHGRPRRVETLSRILDELATRATALSPVMSRPQGPEARTVYFVRRLAAFFERYFGEPHPEYVTAARNAAFNDSATVAQVKRQIGSPRKQ